MAYTNEKEALTELHRRMNDCRLCLQNGHDVFPRAIYSGEHGAQLMTIGQAPGITEKEAGRPFNASSGSRLFQWLNQAGIDEHWFRTTQYMTSVTKCYPGRNHSGSGDRVPSSSEQALCRPFLDDEIRLINPRLIIPIGKLAINLFYRKSAKLKDVIGTQLQIEKRWIVPLPHPSGASRWLNDEANQALLHQAIERIGSITNEVFPNG